MHYVKFFFIKINANKDVIKKIRIWARVFGTGPGPGLPLLLTTFAFLKQLPPFPCRFNFCITPLLQEVQAPGLKFI
jgi:hypothetical protein